VEGLLIDVDFKGADSGFQRILAVGHRSRHAVEGLDKSSQRVIARVGQRQARIASRDAVGGAGQGP
jgi:hypothetical protein